MIQVLTLIFFVLGLIIGSFLNVVIFRYNSSRSFGGRSVCMSCMTHLHWYELVPIFSYLVQGGRCRSCQTKISIQYPSVEFATGVIFAFLFLKFQNVFFGDILVFSLSYAFYAAAFSVLVVICVYDLKHKIIPDLLAGILAIMSFFGLFLFSGYILYPHLPSWWDIFGGLILALPFAFFWLISRGAWMGLGDAKLAVSFGWFLGLAQALSGVVVAFWVGAGVGIMLILFSKNHGMKSQIPFAPFLVFGFMIAFFFDLQLFSVF